ncbi:hypothetical protein HK102_008162 [Quaeritorhiza haematococci]|nr:hypothetical protein HK102_008162 [Quaeritorhiza haematococci]
MYDYTRAVPQEGASENSTPVEKEVSRARVRTREETEQIVRTTIELQAKESETDPVWVQRVKRVEEALAKEGSEGVVRISVIGEANVGKSELVDRLLGAGSPSGSSNASPYGKSSSESLDSKATDEVFDVQYPAEWLKQNRVDIYDVPGIEYFADQPESLKDIIYQSDVVVFVTDWNKQLHGFYESSFFSEFARKPNVVVCVNNVVDGSSSFGKSALSRMETRLARFASAEGGSSAIPLFVISEGSSSGVESLKTHLTGLLNNLSGSSLLRYETAAFTCKQALIRLDASLQVVSAYFAAVESDMRNHLFPNIAKEQKRIRDEGFLKQDLASLDYSVGYLMDALRNYFARMTSWGGIWRLFWSGDTVGDDVKRIMQEHGLKRAEFGMVYATARLNEGVRYQNLLLSLELKHMLQQAESAVTTSTSSTPSPSTPTSSPSTPSQSILSSSANIFSPIPSVSTLLPPRHQNHPSVRAFRYRVTDIVSKLSNYDEQQGVKMDSGRLRTEVTGFMDQAQVAKLADGLQARVDRLVGRTFVGQFSVYSLGLVFTHLGVPWVTSIPSTLAVSALVFAMMRFRWIAYQDHLLSSLSDAHKKLRDRLKDIYNEEFIRYVAEPTSRYIQYVVGSTNSPLNLAAPPSGEKESAMEVKEGQQGEQSLSVVDFKSDIVERVEGVTEALRRV